MKESGNGNLFQTQDLREVITKKRSERTAD